MDVDFMVRIAVDEVPRLLGSLATAGLRVHEERVRSALAQGFEILTFEDTKSPHRVDIILSRRRLRKRLGSILGLPTYYQSPEELVLSKLCMIRATLDADRAAKDRQDVRAILAATKVRLGAVRQRAAQEHTLGLLQELLGRTATRR